MRKSHYYSIIRYSSYSKALGKIVLGNSPRKDGFMDTTVSSTQFKTLTSKPCPDSSVLNGVSGIKNIKVKIEEVDSPR
ncbi:MAG: hypothetical protein KJ666_09705 [Bacteroidetes bacterium]|nr:hypothetical protein [Bacteroidota bacterium]MBU2583982.1 hypothetical protein [Bacteroidota bacterium]